MYEIETYTNVVTLKPKSYNTAHLRNLTVLQHYSFEINLNIANFA